MIIFRDLLFVALPSKVFGLFPIISGEHADNLKFSLLGKLYARALCLLIVVSSFFLVQDVLFSSSEYKMLKHLKGETEDMNRTIETLFCIISYTTMVIASVFNASKHFRTIRDILKIDEYLEEQGYVKVYRCRYLSALIVFVSANVVMVGFYYIHFLSDISPLRQATLTLIYCLQMIYSCIFTVYLRTMLMCLSHRVMFLNTRLDEFSQKHKHAYGKEDWLELSNLIEMFCKFRYITENLNAIVGAGLLFFFGFSFYTVTNQSYLAFATLTTPSYVQKRYETVGLSLAWVLAEITAMVVICISFDCLASEVSRGGCKKGCVTIRIRITVDLFHPKPFLVTYILYQKGTKYNFVSSNNVWTHH